jgi:hypothetical protein
MFEHVEINTRFRLIPQRDGRSRLEQSSFYDNGGPRISFLSADAAYRKLREWRVPEDRILACPGLEGFGPIEASR